MAVQSVDRSCRTGFSRRDFCRHAGVGVAAVAIAPLTATELFAAEGAPRDLSLEFLHTNESLSGEYFRAGEYVPDALEAINHLLRDHRNGAVHPIDPELLDILYDVARETGTRSPFQVISGYRSPETNEMLRLQGRGVASNSMHLKGKAIDIRLADVDSAVLRDVGLALQRGGVGYYRKSDFVHLDTGRVRRW
jgi:uncharacterized protein YcbK (DUF882 family)